VLLAVFASTPSISHAQVQASDTANASIGGVVTGIFEQRRTPLPKAKRAQRV